MRKNLAAQHKSNRRITDAFICGLLHDIGLLVIYRRIPELARGAALRAKSENIDEIDAQTEILGFNHYQVGAQLAQNWLLPEVIVTTIKHHETPEDAHPLNVEAGIIALAHKLSVLLESDSPTSDERPMETISQWKSSGLKPEVLERVLPAVLSQFEAIFQILYRP